MKKIFTTLISAFGLIATMHAQTALNFDGNNDHVVIGNTLTADLEGINTFTVEAWVNSASTTGLGVIVGNYSFPTNNNEMQFQLRRDNNQYTFWLDDGDGYQVVIAGAGSVQVGEWQHVAGTWDGSEIKIYVDGVELGVNSNLDGSGLAATSNGVVIGGNAINEYFQGTIDNIRIWDVTRSEAQINATMNTCLTGNEAGLVANYDFEDGTGSTNLTDITSNGYDGTLVNMDPATDWVGNSFGPQAPMNQQLSSVPSNLICNGSATINVAETQLGAEYYLKNTATGVIVDGPISGTGSDINFNTGIINDTTEYSVYAANFNGPGNALNFDGTNQRAVVQPDPSLMGPNGTFTAEIWASSNTPTWNNMGMVMSFRNIFIFHPTSSNEMQFMIWIDGILRTLTYIVPDVTNWHHYAMSYDGTTFKAFVDGQLVDEMTVSGNMGTTPQSLFIGFDNAPTNRYFNGQVDEARVWSVARSDEQIFSYYDKCLNGNENGLEMYLPMNETSGTVVPDLSGNGNNGILQNTTDAAWISGAVPCPVCDIEMSPTVIVAVDTISDQSISTTTPTICPSGGSVAIDVASSEETIVYSLFDASNDSLVGNPIEGTGSAIVLNSGNITTNTTFGVLAHKPNNGLNFNGSNNIVNMGNAMTVALQGQSELSVEAWVKPASTTGFDVIVGNYNYPSNNSQMQFLLRKTTTYYEFYINGFAVATSPGTVAVDEWQHVAGTWDGSVARIYINGVEMNTSNISGALMITSNSVAIGGNAMSEFFDGVIDEVRIWNVNRSNSAITENLFNCLDGTESGLFAYYKLDEFSGATTTTDATGNGYNGTLLNMDENTAWVSGLVGCECFEIMTSNVSVVLEDTEDPIFIDAVSNITINANAANCEGEATWTMPTAVDNCTANPTVTSSHNPGDAFPLGATTVTITATDDENNSSSITFQVTVVNDLDADTDATDILCNGEENGEIQLTVSGGDGNYSYAWDDAASSTTQNLEDLPEGTYNVTITDGNGCQISASATVTEPDALDAATSVEDALCNGEENGEIELTVTGGTGAYSFEWDDAASSTTQDLENLGAGAYSVEITDENGCELTVSATVAEPDAISASATTTQETMGSDGAIDLTVSGGTGNYTYEWTGPNNYTSTDQNPEDLVGGMYEVTITDENGCTFTLEVEVPSVVGLSENTLDMFKLFPNPSTGKFTISSSAAGTIAIINANGQVIHTTTTHIGETEHQLTHLARGVYSVRLTTEYGVQLKKLVIQ